MWEIFTLCVLLIVILYFFNWTKFLILELECDFNTCDLDPDLASQVNTDLGLSLLFILNYFVSFQRHYFFQSSTDAENPQGSGNATKCQVSMKSKHCYAKFHVPAILAKNKHNYFIQVCISVLSQYGWESSLSPGKFWKGFISSSKNLLSWLKDWLQHDRFQGMVELECPSYTGERITSGWEENVRYQWDTVAIATCKCTTGSG